EDALTWLKNITSGRGFNSDATVPAESSFGGIIFTSQRAVEAFTSIVESLDSHTRDELLPEALPLYVVGPATARGLRSLNLKCQIIGEETGNGAALSAFMLDHYNRLPTSQTSPDLPQEARIGVDEVVIYETCEMASFHIDFAQALEESAASGAKEQWVVVFSPQGCRAMLDCLGWLDEAGRFKADVTDSSSTTTYIATIGPTTRDFLIKEFGPQEHQTTPKKSPTEPNVLNVVLGNIQIKPWYPSFYPEDLVGRKAERLYVCECCFRYSRELMPYLAHRLYSQNLSLFAKLFLDTKSVFYDVTTFRYYVLVLTDPQTGERQVVGFFSKEKMSWDNNNVACILVFPPWQKRGLGQLLMGVSYELSRREGRLGGPEKRENTPFTKSA
ncbi:uroporphyrinogen-III synthase-like protein, partial [Aureobasidium sp. EXF-8846]